MLDAAIETAERWAMHDPDPVMRGQIDQLVDSRSPKLVELFAGRIAFGTAGLRARVGPGPTQMNALVVRQATAGVVAWLARNDITAPRIVIGFDARRDSGDFAAHCAAAVLAGGGTPLLASHWAPTPVFARALLDEKADAAIVITASHNPAPDNGYKLYLGDGLQLVAPADAEIASEIDDLAAHWHEHGIAIDDAYSELVEFERHPVDEWVATHRENAIAALLTSDRKVTVAYTAMHGVGGPVIVDAFEAAGFPAPLLVTDQFDPDPDFPTVPFPNPEEHGALDLAIEAARAADAEAVVANDPDADRLALAVPNRAGDEFVPLSGNDLGVLLADHVLRNTSGDDRLVARSVVSSRQLDAMASAHGVQCEVTLTGFKWIARPIVTQPDARFVFGYEEAIGYCIGDRVRDKDGVTAALVAAEMLAGLRSDRQTVWDRLDELARELGVYANRPVTVRFDDDPSQLNGLMQRVSEAPPPTLAGIEVVQSGAVGLGALPPTAGLHMLTADDTQVIIRPSGTEPKIKAYLEVLEPVVGAEVASARSTAAVRLAAVAADVTQLLS